MPVLALDSNTSFLLIKKFSKEDFISRLLTSTNNIDAYLTGSAMKLMVEGGQYVSVDVFQKKGKMGAGAVDAWQFLMALEGTPSFLTSPGKPLTIDVAECIGDTAANFVYTLEISQETKTALGITGEPTMANGSLVLNCSKIGAGKIRF